ncbi:bifunctional adenosylcobinamide kinase/adenosylcobinamide-phosphate guanylyltransferase [Vibrio amylolyticus]|uniref:bifunctional adenosylcobinamide kinase/adenosylcobinamide-phosphate guanylyltransferase n=1 Tax=Vibrio amylolyticus TaxID=2847292 RepID=UPI00354AEA7E
MSVRLILGGARSGKSSHAERIAKASVEKSHNEGRSMRLNYVATAIAFDDEMRSRIKHHQQQRGSSWHEHEVPVALPHALSRFTEEDVVLVDCLTVWLNNIIFQLGDNVTDEAIKVHINKLIEVLEGSPATMILVSNEVGLGVIPLGEVSRLFVDHAGWMNQRIAAIASNVELIAAGLPLTLKPQPLISSM